MGQLQAQFRSSAQTALRSIAFVCLNPDFDCVKKASASKTCSLDAASGSDHFSSSKTTTMNSHRFGAFFVPKHNGCIVSK
mgnify:CR=1 FL=1|jgi:hypothetical protein